MFCCIAGVAALGSGAASRLTRRWRGALIGVAALALTGFAAHHFDHYAARATANNRDIMAEIRAMPICSGAPLA
ncbi:hypothetical protein [Sphingomonas cavernae]|uniref:Uncharacterized protein n=1 Tax=Sphingomonas cavernae TaxID=2320861 RepID=A0A418WS38_9SPHN|nr:hypothetical protein [Sphingomonas cavernae]RJF94073.1 hypothetical protein D3876_07380 [Sphingomonas cavernae]